VIFRSTVQHREVLSAILRASVVLNDATNRMSFVSLVAFVPQRLNPA